MEDKEAEKSRAAEEKPRLIDLLTQSIDTGERFPRPEDDWKLPPSWYKLEPSMLYNPSPISLSLRYRTIPAILADAVELELPLQKVTGGEKERGAIHPTENHQTPDRGREDDQNPRQTSDTTLLGPGDSEKWATRVGIEGLDFFTRNIVRLPILDSNGNYQPGVLSEQLPRIECNSCYLAEECPAYKENNPCAFNSLEDQFDTTTTEGLKALLDMLLQIDKTRTLRQILVERMTTGGLYDPKTSQAMDRLRQSIGTTIQMKANIEALEDGPPVTTNQTTIQITNSQTPNDGKGKGKQQPSILMSIFGGGLTEPGTPAMIDTTGEEVKD
jgi:hypothetical protein